MSHHWDDEAFKDASYAAVSQSQPKLTVKCQQCQKVIDIKLSYNSGTATGYTYSFQESQVQALLRIGWRCKNYQWFCRDCYDESQEEEEERPPLQ